MNAAFLLGCVCSPKVPEAARLVRGDAWLVRSGVVAALVAIGAHWMSLHIDLVHHDWNHSHISAGLRTLADVGTLFSRPQADGFYRPLTFLSLWFDYAMFHQAALAYHIHSLILHIVNALLVGLLARTIGYGGSVAGWAAALYACVPASFEPVTWPAARFDLLSTMFTLLAIVCSLQYLKDGGRWIAGAAICLLLGLLNKESTYAVPAVVAVWVFLGPRFGHEPARREQVIRLFAVLLAICAALLVVRFTVFGSMGGYPVAPGGSSQFAVGLRTLASVFTRLLPLSVATFNTTFVEPLVDRRYLRVLMLALPAVLVSTCAVARAGKRELFLLCLLLASALPVLNLAGWIGPPSQHSRYLYLPACWICILIPALVESSRFRNALLWGWIGAFAICLSVDQLVYRVMLERIPPTVAMVQGEAVAGHADAVSLVDVREDPYGVFYLRWELVERLKAALPGVAIAPHAGPDARGLRYAWAGEGESLLRRLP
jgi:hypothetical protein